MAIQSVLELAKYSPTSTVYWITFGSALRDNEVIINPEDVWMLHHHPKILYDRKKIQWPLKVKLPRLYSVDFQCVTLLVTSKLDIKEFNIVETHRSTGTGEFYYKNEKDEWMPESCLFDSEAAARRERDRILAMVKSWATNG